MNTQPTNMQAILQLLLNNCYDAFGVTNDAYISTRSYRKDIAEHAFCKIAYDCFGIPIYELEIFLQPHLAANIIEGFCGDCTLPRPQNSGSKVDVIKSICKAQSLIDKNDHQFMECWCALQGYYADTNQSVGVTGPAH